ncbi:MAG: GNAT family N-acetyltransferase [Acidimicrobiales bacterium]
MTDAPAPSPDGSRWEADVVLADGGTVHVRPIRPEDAPLIEEFHARQSAESIYFRYFSPRPRLSPAELHHLTHVDYRDRIAFVALLADELVGVARYDRPASQVEAEVAFFIDDEHRGRGIATLLLEYLAAYARDHGIPSFVASVLPSNRRMLGVFRQAGFEVSSRFDDGVVAVRLGIEPTPDALAAMEERARRAEARSVARLLEPQSVAVVGAGRAADGLGHQVLRNLLRHEFAGPVYPVNPDASHVASVRAYASVLDIPDRVDLAVIAVPAAEVLDVVEECARARVGGLIVISAGFSESGSEGVEREQRLVDSARRHGVRLIGPNCLGVVNTDPAVRLFATFASVEPIEGGAALSAQPGTLGAAIVERTRAIGLGLSAMVAVGNKADVSGNDLLRYWETDPRTRLVLLYLESFGNPRRFSRAARRVSRTKPIVAVKTGREPSSEALLGQTGVVRVDTLDDLLDVARVLATQPLSPGRRLVVVANDRGSGELAADAAVAVGLDATVVDLTYRAGAPEYANALRGVLADPGVDQALVVYAPSTRPDPDGVGAAVLAAAEAEATKPVAVSFFAGETPSMLGGGGHPPRAVPNFTFPDAAARALGRAAGYGAWRRQPDGEAPEFDDVDVDAARELVGRALADRADPAGAVRLDAASAVRLLELGGVPVVPQRVATTANDAVDIAADIGWPVALKVVNVEPRSKSEAGGVALDLHDERELRASIDRMIGVLGAAAVPVVVQSMIEPGVDIRVGVTSDPLVGPVIGVGIGGVAWEALRSETVRILPLTDLDAARLVACAPAARPLVDRERRSALEWFLLRLGHLVDHVPDIAEVVCNPVIVNASGAWTTDVRVQVAAHERPAAVRRL